MKVLVTGVNGQLGHDVIDELIKRGHQSIASGRTLDRNSEINENATYVAMDVTDTEMVRSTIQVLQPDAVIHCAAWTAVNAAEEPQNVETVFKVNSDSTAHIAQACKEIGCKMLYISTDYVFGGQGTRPWEPDDECAPLNIYGRSKHEGEISVSSLTEKYFIVRISWSFGLHGKNFVKTMLNLGKSRSSIRVVNDQIGTPTYTRDLSRLLVDMIETEKYGYYHASNEGGYISWCDFAEEIFRQAGCSVEVIPVSTEEYGRRGATRPLNSRLDKSKLLKNGFSPLPDWKDALARFLNDYEEK